MLILPIKCLVLAVVGYFKSSETKSLLRDVYLQNEAVDHLLLKGFCLGNGLKLREKWQNSITVTITNDFSTAYSVLHLHTAQAVAFSSSIVNMNSPDVFVNGFGATQFNAASLVFE
jgi:hypothetical protein